MINPIPLFVPRTAQGHKKDGEEVLKYADQSCSMIQSRCLTFGAHRGRQGGAGAADEAGGTIYLLSKNAIYDQLPNLCSQTWPQDNKEAQEELSTLAVQLASIVDTLDKIAADSEAMEDAALQFDSLLQARGLVCGSLIEQIARRHIGGMNGSHLHLPVCASLCVTLSTYNLLSLSSSKP